MKLTLPNLGTSYKRWPADALAANKSLWFKAMPPAVATANTCMNSRRLKLINIPFQLITDICVKKKRAPNAPFDMTGPILADETRQTAYLLTGDAGSSNKAMTFCSWVSFKIPMWPARGI